jgi:IS66 C-terminal element
MHAARPECDAHSAQRADASDSGSRHPARYGQNDCAIALGRKNWLFAGSDSGGERAALFYTLIRTATLNGVEPEAYLRDVIARIGSHPVNRLNQLLPWNIATPATRSVAA